ncbi:hypothetical protein AXF42_Ash003405 [Apostasia shenzhenica]|uniref:DUF6821 domain-containing protein n=1 Tax=Apostasia shenzhenica TaxID=1088818 RepID=A0A2I0BG12_9ASPA|nr:hypothetical protein AXF42_Ash003405 [Apostasia shenzhenica]
MEGSTDLHDADWELVPSSSLPDSTPKVVDVLDEGTEDRTIKADYFSPYSGGLQRPQSEGESDDGRVDSGKNSWGSPDPDSRFLGTSTGQLGFVEASDPQSSLANSEKVDLGSLGGSVIETGSETLDDGCDDLGKGSEGEECSDSREMIPIDGDVSVIKSENGGKIWWKMPMELLKFCFLRIRPVWSLSIAAAVVGIVILGRKLRKMKHKNQSIRLRIAVDDKKNSQQMARAARLNEAFSVVRLIPFIRPSLTSGGAARWASLPHG